ncbi:MAG: ATP-binding protein [Gammaproteobacteria bacterium]|nr:ATP-binding protein [Gammaproteobacteria bacterium]
MTTRAKRTVRKPAIRGKVRAHDPFELIRWIAMSQPDPRKALAELVQNSLDAGARQIRVNRARLRGNPSIRIIDDGDGVIPELERTEALRYIATHIGHSRKRDLTPKQRMQLMTQGQYGIGLLGFWSIGKEMLIRSAVSGQKPMTLSLRRDSPEFEIDFAGGRLPLEERWTEVLITNVHPEVVSILGGRRIAEYLAAELRGQLLARDVELVIEDRMARGRSQKLIPVRPPRFLGERIQGLGPIEVPGYPSIQLEIYFHADEDGEQALSVYAAGTLVAEDFHELANLDLDHEPWTDSRLCGLVEFAGFQVSPGTRRGVVPDAAAAGFAAGLAKAALDLERILAEREAQRAARVDHTLLRDLKRAFRDFFSARPEFSVLQLHEKGAAVSVRADDWGGTGETIAVSGLPAEPADDAPAQRFPEAGPLYAVAITPTPIRVERLGSRRVHARPVDRSGRAIRKGVHFEWKLDPDVGRLVDVAAMGSAATIEAGAGVAIGNLSVIASQEEHVAQAKRVVEIVEAIEPTRSSGGIPTPEFVHEPGANWRSRMVAGHWQVNSGHRDWGEVAERPALKLRYVAMLFAKEIVVRSHNDPRLAGPLEQLVDVASYADRNTAPRGSAGRKKRKRKR